MTTFSKLRAEDLVSWALGELIRVTWLAIISTSQLCYQQDIHRFTKSERRWLGADSPEPRLKEAPEFPLEMTCAPRWIPWWISSLPGKIIQALRPKLLFHPASRNQTLHHSTEGTEERIMTDLHRGNSQASELRAY